MREHKQNTKLVHVSTDEVYGDIINKRSSKEEDRYNPSSPYAASKAGSDLLILSYVRTFKTPAIITNCCNNFGPGQFPEKLIPTIINNIIKNKNIPIYGNGTNSREWIYVDDHAEGLIAVSKKGLIGHQYNIGSGIRLNNLDIVNKILRAKNKHEKEYHVVVDKPINSDFIKKMSNGIPLHELEMTTKKCYVERISRFAFRIILVQGLNRQIRRMCEYLGFKVVQLKRIRIMNIHLDLPVGKWRDLTERELAELNSLIADSSKTFE